MIKSEWGLIFTAVFLLLLSVLFDPMLTVGLALVLLVGFAIMRTIKSDNQQFE